MINIHVTTLQFHSVLGSLLAGAMPDFATWGCSHKIQQHTFNSSVIRAHFTRHNVYARNVEMWCKGMIIWSTMEKSVSHICTTRSLQRSAHLALSVTQYLHNKLNTFKFASVIHYPFVSQHKLSLTVCHFKLFVIVQFS